MADCDRSIFTAPNLTDGFETIDRKVANEFFQGFLKNMSTWGEYAHGVVGSSKLAEYYEELDETYNLWGARAEFDGPQPVAALSQDEETQLFSIGSINRAKPEGSYPNSLYSCSVKAPRSGGDEFNFSLYLNLGSTVTTADSNGSKMIRHNFPQSMFPCHIEETIWTRNEGDDFYSVERNSLLTQIAFGERALKHLPDFDKYRLVAVTQDLALSRLK